MLQTLAWDILDWMHTKLAYSIQISFFLFHNLKEGKNDFCIFLPQRCFNQYSQSCQSKAKVSLSKGSGNKYFRFCGPCTVFLQLLKISHCTVKAAIDTQQMSGVGYVSIKLYLEKQAMSQIWPLRHSLLTPTLRFCLSFIDAMVCSSPGLFLSQNKTNQIKTQHNATQANSKSRWERDSCIPWKRFGARRVVTWCKCSCPSTLEKS